MALEDRGPRRPVDGCDFSGRARSGCPLRDKLVEVIFHGVPPIRTEGRAVLQPVDEVAEVKSTTFVCGDVVCP
jgi:hypothetical protein